MSQFFLEEDGMEGFLQESANDLRMQPSLQVWQGVQKKLHPSPKWPYLAAALGVFATGVLTGFWLDRESSPVSPLLPIDPPNTATQQRPTPSSPGIDGIDAIKLPLTLLQASPFTPAIFPGLGMKDAPDASLSLSPLSRPQLGWPSLPGLPAAYSDEMDLFLPTGRTPALRSNSAPIGSAPATAESAPAPKAKNLSRLNLLASQTTDRIIHQISHLGRKTNLQVYISPSVSYRRLLGQASNLSYPYTNGFVYSANLGFPAEVKDAVNHKPGLGLEAGAALLYPLSRSLRIKAGLQMNFTSYDIEAFSYTPELAPFSAAPGGGVSPAIQSVSYYRSRGGYRQTWLSNSHLMISMPMGFEYTIGGHRKLSLTVASTLQPSYMLQNKAYLISTDLKNYAEEPDLQRNWNLNAGAEAYLSMRAGTYRWVMGPQIRYQLLSSYQLDYPIREHLVDFGFKVGIQKTLR
ncbi:MAG: hypothetical protein FJX89_04060 [Bacteroidetes bacterium]|nr:hypothetical protein [Bacteroidota bacterium]